MNELRHWEFYDPANTVEFSRAEQMRDDHGCAVCEFRPKAWGEKCSKKKQPVKGKPFCWEFELEGCVDGDR